MRIALPSTGGKVLAGIDLTTAATTSSKLDTDPTMGLQLSVEACSGTSVAPPPASPPSPWCPFCDDGRAPRPSPPSPRTTARHQENP